MPDDDKKIKPSERKVDETTNAVNYNIVHNADPATGEIAANIECVNRLGFGEEKATRFIEARKTEIAEK